MTSVHSTVWTMMISNQGMLSQPIVSTRAKRYRKLMSQPAWWIFQTWGGPHNWKMKSKE